MVWAIGFKRLGFSVSVYFGGSVDLVSRLITPITHIVNLVIPLTSNLLLKSPKP